MKNLRLPKLPEDVKRYLQKKITARIAKCVLFELAVMLLLIFMGERLFSGLGTIGQMLIYIVLMILPFIVTGVPLELIDKSWNGEVIDVDIKATTAFTKGVRSKQYTENSVWLTIRKNDGDVIYKKIAVFSLKEGNRYNPIYAASKVSNVKPEHFLKKYNVGAKVFHFYGFENCLIVDEKNDDIIRCIVCGQENDQNNKKCWNCGHSLIKF